MRHRIREWGLAYRHNTKRFLVGLARTDNNMEFTTWPQVNMINQKNYYTYV